MADEKTTQTKMETIDKALSRLIASIDERYDRVENDLTNALTEIRTLRWQLENFNTLRYRKDMKIIRKVAEELRKDVEGATVSMDRVAEKMKEQREQAEEAKKDETNQDE